VRARGDGDGWVECSCGARHWGRYGAAGLLLLHDGRVLMQHRAEWSHHGGTWGLPGGARASTEDPVAAALRESAEEAGIDPSPVEVCAVWLEDHGTWSYATVMGESRVPLAAAPTDAESIAVSWMPVDEVAGLPLHPGLAAAWSGLDSALGRRLVLVVDVANVMGSRPDGWWRDRAGAAARLLASLARLRRAALGDGLVPSGTPAQLSWLPRVVAVVEGGARGVDAPPGVEVVRATGAGDDALVTAVSRIGRERPSDHVVVVTADRGLARRVEALGAQIARPSALLKAVAG
jgi:8-oxo-dGTP pyrophosphatase MutT (NUDIX family)